MDRQHILVQLRRRLAIFREQGDLAELLRLALESIDGLAPRQALTVVDLAKIEHLAFGAAPVGEPIALHHTPVAVDLAVLLSLVALQVHREPRSYPKTGKQGKGSGLPHKPSAASPKNFRRLLSLLPTHFRKLSRPAARTERILEKKNQSRGQS